MFTCLHHVPGNARILAQACVRQGSLDLRSTRKPAMMDEVACMSWPYRGVVTLPCRQLTKYTRWALDRVYLEILLFVISPQPL